MFGAASYISYFMCFLLFCGFCVKSELRLKVHFITHNIRDYRTEFCDFSRQGVVSILAIILNHTLYSYGEHSIAVYGIISRMLMFALFPILGITQGLFHCWL
jgi:Na+-driven multidrug efflux pump